MNSNIENPIDKITREHRALATLRLLNAATEYKSNEHLHLDLLAAIGLPCSHQEFEDCLSRLENSALISTHVFESIRILELTDLGMEVAKGTHWIEGVLRPPPDCRY